MSLSVGHSDRSGGRWSSVVLILLLGGAVSGDAAVPEVSSVRPPGGSRGTTQSLAFRGKRLGDAADLLFYGPGITCTNLVALGNKGVQVRADIVIAEDCPLGEHPFRLRTATGLSGLRTLWVGPFPDLAETEPNNTPLDAQSVPLNVTITGLITTEDVDVFAMDGEEGQRLSVEVEGMRLGAGFLDPHLAVVDESGHRIAVNDDCPLFPPDAALSVRLPRAARYFIQIRDSAFGGDDRCLYRLHVGDFPRPTQVFPPGGPPGTQRTVRFLGDALGPIEQSVTVPDPHPTGLAALYPDSATPVPSPLHFRAIAGTDVNETEPNDRRQDASPSDVQPPFAFHGILAKTGDVDYFAFQGRKDQTLEFQVFAKRIGSPVDPVLNLYDDKGKRLGGNDDNQGNLDSFVRLRIPADGRYTCRVNDYIKASGDLYVYRIECTEAEATVAVDVPTARRNREERQTIVVPRDNRYAARLQVKRENFGDGLTVDIPELPAGMTVTIPPAWKELNQVPALFEASADAPLAGLAVPVHLQPEDPGKRIRGGFDQTIPLVLGQPNNSVYYQARLYRLAAAVAEPAPFRVRVDPPSVPLVHGGSMDLVVAVDRDEGFDKPVTLRMVYNPPGIGSASSVRIPSGQDRGTYRVNASGQAKARVYSLAVTGSANPGSGEVYVSSDLIPLEVAGPFLAGIMDLTASPRGTLVDVVCTLDQHRPFLGKAKVRLLGLPPKTTSEEIHITSESTEAVFPVDIREDAPLGKHATLFCQVDVPVGDGVVPHSIGGMGTLRIDPPPAEKAPPPPRPEPSGKRLSRLEQLRQQQARKDSAS